MNAQPLADLGLGTGEWGGVIVDEPALCSLGKDSLPVTGSRTLLYPIQFLRKECASTTKCFFSTFTHKVQPVRLAYQKQAEGIKLQRKGTKNIACKLQTITLPKPEHEPS